MSVSFGSANTANAKNENGGLSATRVPGIYIVQYNVIYIVFVCI